MLKDEDWWVLRRSIEESHCVLMLGPGVALDPSTPESPSLAAQLALRLSNDLPLSAREVDLVEPENLAHVAQLYLHRSPTGRMGLEFAVVNFYEPFRHLTTQLHLDLAALPFTLCVTTTPDRFLFNAFAQTPGKSPHYDFYNFSPDPSRARERHDAASPQACDASHPLVYSLHGSVDDPGSLILTENDLLDFLVNVTRGSPSLDPYVTSLFSDPNTTFLFIGFGFRAWYLRILLHVLKVRSHKRPSIVLEDSAFFGTQEGQETVVFFKMGDLIEFHQIPWQTFARELRQRFKSVSASERNGARRTAVPPPDAPVAFLCHDSRDKEKAEGIAKQLLERKINIWLDKQNLRGGDRWPMLIPDVIEKQCDYAVVLQSPRMLDKGESYFYREIKLAMEREQGFAPNVRFIIPVLIEHDPNLPMGLLATYHYIDLTQPGGIDSLAQSILEDWEKRPSAIGMRTSP